MADASMGFQSRLSLAPVGTAIASYTEAFEFVSESLQKRQTILETAGLRGSRSHPVERTRDGTYAVRGAIRLHATPSILDLLLPRILGAAESADVFNLAETLPEFDVLVDRVARRFVYGACKIDRATIRSRAGGLLELTLELAGKTETPSTTAFPNISGPTDPPYVFHDSTLTLLGTPRKLIEFELIVDNALAARFTNSPSATDVSPRDRVVTFRCTTPWTTDETDLYGQNAGGAGAASLVFVNGGYSTTFSMPKVQFPDASPTVGGREEIVLRLAGVARKSGSTNELTVTHDSTP